MNSIICNYINFENNNFLIKYLYEMVDFVSQILYSFCDRGIYENVIAKFNFRKNRV